MDRRVWHQVRSLKQRNHREAKRRVLLIKVHGKLNISCIVGFCFPEAAGDVPRRWLRGDSLGVFILYNNNSN